MMISGENRKWWVIFGVFFLLYYSGTRFNLDGYELEYVLSAMNIYHGNGVHMAHGFQELPGVSDTTGEQRQYPRQNYLQSFLSVPFYAAGALLFGESPTIPEKGRFWMLPWGPLATVAMLNPLLSAGIAVLTGLLAIRLGMSRSQGMTLAVVTGGCTMIWPYAGLGMEVLQTFILLLTTWCAVSYRLTRKTGFFILSMACIILLINCKKYSFIFAIPLCIYLFSSLEKSDARKPVLWLISLGAVGVAAVSMGFILWQKELETPGYLLHLARHFTGPSFPLVDIATGLTISPGEGLFSFNPILLFAVPGWWRLRRTHPAEFRLFAGLLAVLLLAIWRLPYLLIEEEWGPRYFHVMIPYFVAAGGTSILAERKPAARRLLAAVLVISILIQGLGALFLGFKTMDAGIELGTADYLSLVFIPSLSQIYISGLFFVSTIHRYITGESLDLTHIRYRTYSGLGAEHFEQRINLRGFDHPAGGFFTMGWVLSEMGRPLCPEWCYLIAWLLLTVTCGYTLFRIAVSGAPFNPSSSRNRKTPAHKATP